MAFTLVLIATVGIVSTFASQPTPRQKAEEVIKAFTEVGLIDDVRPCFHYIEATFGDHNEWYSQFEIAETEDGPQLTGVPQAFACMQQCIDFALRLTGEKNITSQSEFDEFVDIYGKKIPFGVRFRPETKEHFAECSKPLKDAVSIIPSDVATELEEDLVESCKLDFDIVYCLNKQTFFHKWDQQNWVDYWNELFNIIQEEDAEEGTANPEDPEVLEGEGAKEPEKEHPHGDHEEEEEMLHHLAEEVPPVPEP